MSAVCSPIANWGTRLSQCVAALGQPALVENSAEECCTLANQILNNNTTVQVAEPVDALPELHDFDPDKTYFALLLNAITAEGQTISLGAAGVVFFEPALALYAAIQASGNSVSPKLLPQASSYAGMAEVAKQCADFFGNKENSVENNMQAVAGFLAPRPQFTVVRLSGESCQILAKEGGATILVGGALAFVELYAK